MPRKLSEIKEFVSKKSLENIQENPAQNSVLGNVQKLHDLLEGENDFELRTLREQLNTIVGAYKGEVSEEEGDKAIEFLHPVLELAYMTKVGNSAMRLQDEKKREELKTLIEYVSGGLKAADNLKFESKIALSDEQKANLDHMEQTGKAEVRNEKREAEAQARRDAVAGKSGLNVLDEYRAKIGALPKSFRGAGADIKEAAARQQLKGLCFDIMSTRRAIEAKRNDKSGLSKASVNADLQHSIKQDMLKSKAMESFLNSMSYKDLRDLAYSGHGGAMEEKFADYLRKGAEAIPEDAPQQYMPTAKDRIDALKVKMDTVGFRKQSTPAEQRKLYIELMATRAAVGSKRGMKSSLNPVVNPQILEQERKKFAKEPLLSALVRVTQMGEKQQAACEAALSGHGGALEDLVRVELRRMALEKDSGYKMQDVDPRYAPTFDQRRNDLRGLIDSGTLSVKEQFRAEVERGVLEQMQGERKGDERIGNIESVNRQVDTKIALYSKIMDENSMREFVADAKTHGYEEATYRFDAAHMGQLKAIQKGEDLEKQLAGEPELDDLKKIAAQKMVLLKHKTQFQADKDNDKLSAALDKEQFDKNVEKMMKDHLFKEVCDKLGPNGLKAQAKGDGEKLVESYALAKADKLEPYKPEAPAVKNGPQKDVQNKGPQAGGPQA